MPRKSESEVKRLATKVSVNTRDTHYIGENETRVK
jgi:hypothetical protein